MSTSRITEGEKLKF